MAIYNRFYDEIEILPPAEGDPDYTTESRLRIRYKDNGKEDVADVQFLKADDGLKEIDAAINQINTKRSHQ